MSCSFFALLVVHFSSLLFQVGDDVKQLIGTLNAAANNWRDSVEFAADFDFQQGSAESLGACAERQIDAVGDIVAQGSRAYGMVVISKKGFRESFRIVGKSDFNPTAKRQTWGSRDYGYFGSVAYRLSPGEESSFGDIAATGERIRFFGIENVSEGTKNPSSFSPLTFCGGLKGEPLINLDRPNLSVTDAVYEAAEGGRSLEIRLSVEARKGYTSDYLYKFRTVGAYPLLEKLSIRSFDSGEMISESVSRITSFTEIAPAVYIPLKYETAFGPVVNASNGNQEYIWRKWNFRDVKSKPEEIVESFRIEVEEEVSFGGLSIVPEHADGFVDLTAIDVGHLVDRGESQDATESELLSADETQNEEMSDEADFPYWFALTAFIVAICLIVYSRKGR